MKRNKVICQQADQEFMQTTGLVNAEVIETKTSFEITITRIDGNHRSQEIIKRMGEFSGFILQAYNEPIKT